MKRKGHERRHCSGDDSGRGAGTREMKYDDLSRTWRISRSRFREEYEKILW